MLRTRIGVFVFPAVHCSKSGAGTQHRNPASRSSAARRGPSVVWVNAHADEDFTAARRHLFFRRRNTKVSKRQFRVTVEDDLLRRCASEHPRARQTRRTADNRYFYRSISRTYPDASRSRTSLIPTLNVPMVTHRTHRSGCRNLRTDSLAGRRPQTPLGVCLVRQFAFKNTPSLATIDLGCSYAFPRSMDLHRQRSARFSLAEAMAGKLNFAVWRFLWRISALRR